MNRFLLGASDAESASESLLNLFKNRTEWDELAFNRLWNGRMLSLGCSLLYTLYELNEAELLYSPNYDRTVSQETKEIKEITEEVFLGFLDYNKFLDLYAVLISKHVVNLRFRDSGKPSFEAITKIDSYVHSIGSGLNGWTITAQEGGKKMFEKDAEALRALVTGDSHFRLDKQS